MPSGSCQAAGIGKFKKVFRHLSYSHFVIQCAAQETESLFGLVSCFDTGLDSAFHIRKKFTLFQLLSASPKKRQGHTQCMHLVHTSFTSENNIGKILSLTKSIFDIKMMVKSSAIERKSSPTRGFRVVGLPSTKKPCRKVESAQLSGISKGTCII